MISGIDLNQTIDYTCKGDTENPTVWKLGVIPSYVLGQLSAKAAQSDQIEMAYKLLQMSIKGWVNFNVEYKTIKETLFGRELDIVPLDIVEQIPLAVINELSAKILEINGLSTVERKN